jgi:SAM-dependent methyltransferase
LNRIELEERLKQYRFYHFIEVEPGLTTVGDPRMVPQQDLVMRNLRALPLAGKRVLDIGCRDGLFSLEAERLGAAEVVGVDNDLSRGSTELLLPYLESRVRMHGMNLYDLTPGSFGKFDVIVFAGVLYHLRYPVYALKLIRDLLNDGGTLLLETAVLPAWERYQMLYCPTAEASPYEPTSVTFFNNNGMRSTLESLGYRVLSTDRLYGHRIRSTRGAGTRQYLIAASVALQRAFPGLVHRALGRFAIDRGVFVCSAGQPDSSLRAYWDETHEAHTVGHPWGN